MRHFNIDWTEVIDRLDVWEELSPAGRASYTQLRPGEYKSWLTFDDEDRYLLFSQDMIAPDQYDRRVKLGASGRDFSKAMRGMARHPLDHTSDVSAAGAYAKDHFTTEERQALLHSSDDRHSSGGSEAHHLVTREAWVQEFLKLDSAPAALRWERSRLPEQVGAQFRDGSPYFDNAQVFHATKWLVESALTWSEPTPLPELAKRVGGAEPELVHRAILPAVRYMLLFPWLSGEELIPVIGLWPPITHLRHRPPARPPSPVEPEQTFHAPLLAEDMATALIAAASDPLRLRANEETLYAKDQKRLTEAMPPVPDWLIPEYDSEQTLQQGVPFMGVEDRLHDALNSCLSRDLLRRAETPRRRLEATNYGRDWLAMDVRQRACDLVEPWRERDTPSRAEKDDGSSLNVAQQVNGEIIIESAKVHLSPWLPPSLRRAIDREAAEQVDWREAFLDVLTHAADGKFLSISELLSYHCRVNNPLLGRRREGDYGPQPRVWNYRGVMDELTLEDLWFRVVANTLEELLLPLGAIELGRTGNSYVMRLHPIGRYMLGLADEVEYEAPTQGSVIVQPNFEVTFMGPSPQAEAVVGRMAQRIGHGSGTLFRITKESVLTAAAAGLSAERALEELSEVCSKPLPENVKREISGWFKSVRYASMRKTCVIESPDEQTAARVRAAAGKSARSISPTVVEISAGKGQSALRRKLKERGIFIQE